MNRDPENSTSVRCEACGFENDPGTVRSARDLARTFVVVVACASCRSPFVVLSRN